MIFLSHFLAQSLKRCCLKKIPQGTFKCPKMDENGARGQGEQLSPSARAILVKKAVLF